MTPANNPAEAVEAQTYEAVVNGVEHDTYDPVVGVTIHTDRYSYDLLPELGLTRIDIRPHRRSTPTEGETE